MYHRIQSHTHHRQTHYQAMIHPMTENTEKPKEKNAIKEKLLKTRETGLVRLIADRL